MVRGRLPPRSPRSRQESSLQPPPGGVLDVGLRGQQVDLGKLKMKLTDLVLAPDRGVELVMRDRRQHEEPGRGRVVALIYPVGALHCLPARCDPGPQHVPLGVVAWPAHVESAAGQGVEKRIARYLAAFIGASFRSGLLLAPVPYSG